MPSPKAKKIDFDKDYPCPCGRRGRILPITLTEAFGCDRCQQIFVVEESGQVLEQLSTTYPYKKAWLWTGTRWHRAHTGLKDHYLPLSLFIIVVLLGLWLVLALHAPKDSKVIPWLLASVLLATLPALIFWLAYRR